MNLLTIENLSKVFTERQVFGQADFSVNEGEKIGVIGVNGTGKVPCSRSSPVWRSRTAAK